MIVALQDDADFHVMLILMSCKVARDRCLNVDPGVDIDVNINVDINVERLGTYIAKRSATHSAHLCRNMTESI